jgi:hypothetical protein
MRSIVPVLSTPMEEASQLGCKVFLILDFLAGVAVVDVPPSCLGIFASAAPFSLRKKPRTVFADNNAS